MDKVFSAMKGLDFAVEVLPLEVREHRQTFRPFSNEATRNPLFRFL
jgi:hypothetical protein